MRVQWFEKNGKSTTYDSGVNIADACSKHRRRLPISERLVYIDAVKCIMRKPPLTSLKDVPGVTSRYDDYVATHIIQADDVHFNVGSHTWQN